MITLEKNDQRVKEYGLDVTHTSYINSTVKIEMPVQLGGVYLGGVEEQIGAFTYIAGGGKLRE